MAPDVPVLWQTWLLLKGHQEALVLELSYSEERGPHSRSAITYWTVIVQHLAVVLILYVFLTMKLLGVGNLENVVI